MEEQNTNTNQQPQVLPPVPGAIGALVFGIISLVLCWYFWFPIVGLIFNIACLIFAILAMNKGGKAMKEFEANAGKFKPGSLGLAKVGRILGIVGLILNIIFVIIAVIMTIIGGAALSNM